MIQLALAVLSLVAFSLATSPRPRARSWAPWAGILAQVAWVHEIDWRGQWGIGTVCLGYLARYVWLAWLPWRCRTRPGA